VQGIPPLVLPLTYFFRSPINERKVKWREVNSMRKIIQVRVYKGEKYYVAECVDLPVVTQGKTLDEVAANIREAIDLHLEGENLEDWDILPDFSILANLELEPAHAKA
jgi:predicted RNase H-like HicB family nuclease